MTNPGAVKQIPYGLTDYKRIRSQNYYYVDKTRYITMLEDMGSFLFFIRPRRFGKSFFLSLLESYYDVYYKDQLEELFSGTWIYDHPTPDRGQYLVLSFNFSQMELAQEKLETSFINYTKRTALSFLRKYADLLLKDVDFTKKNIEESLSPADILSTVIGFCKDSHRDLYVIVDEYDNFANTLLTTSGSAAYLEVTRGKGFLRSFFN
ncbi:MAG: AAA family ATPase, partial [Acidobacteria bacterium]|nr:AAA family ATPase [Acidobacteriota bacterium]